MNEVLDVWFKANFVIVPLAMIISGVLYSESVCIKGLEETKEGFLLNLLIGAVAGALWLPLVVLYCIVAFLTRVAGMIKDFYNYWKNLKNNDL